ncbi:MAG: YebC/PmpR family DNA-binding transcriptional regulator [Myxococcota bacterium]
MSGHSKWATIKHKKGAADAKRGRLFTKLIREITVSARMGGGDASNNPRLRKAVADAKGQQMPQDTIQRAIKRGTGELEGANYEEVLYEGTGPGGTLLLIEGVTDNRNRTVAELRKIFEKHNGSLGSSGTAAWAFDRKGVFQIPSSVGEDQLMDVAIEAGADDYENTGDAWQVTAPVEAFDAVTKAFESADIEIQQSGLEYLPKAKKPLAGRDAEVVLNLTDALDDHDDVQNVFADFDISDEEMARISGE